MNACKIQPEYKMRKMNHNQHILITCIHTENTTLKNTEINLIHCTTLTTKMQHQKTLDNRYVNSKSDTDISILSFKQCTLLAAYAE